MNMIDKLDRWAAVVPDSEMELPLFVIRRRGGEAVITPQQARRSLRKRMSRIGNRLRVESSDPSDGAGSTRHDLVAMRLERRLQQLPPDMRDKPTMISLSGDVVSPERELQEIKDNTALGRELREMNERYIAWLCKRYKDV